MRRPPFLIRLARRLLREELRNLELQAENAQMQLGTCRALLATTMRERDKFEAALDNVCADLALLKKQRRRERQQIRFWITRSRVPKAIAKARWN